MTTGSANAELPPDQTGDIALEVSDGIATVILSNPGKKNAISVSMAQKMLDIAERLDGDTRIACCVIRGDDQTFCSGAVASALDQTAVDPASPAEYGRASLVYGAVARVATLQVPTISAVRGAAVGAGFNLMMSTDVRIVADNRASPVRVRPYWSTSRRRAWCTDSQPISARNCNRDGCV